MTLNETAVRIAVKIIKQFEGCNLRSYPDPASPLYKALSTHGMLQRYMSGAIKWKDLAENFQALSGNPFTCGHGETQGVTKDTVWTPEEATSRLEARVRGFMQDVLEASPKLATQAPERIAAVTSLCYNIGLGNYEHSTVARLIAVEDWTGAAKAFLMWVKAGGLVMAGLEKRRKIESELFMSVTS
jgi:lysozyme